MLQDIQSSVVVKQRTRNKLLLFLGLIVVILSSFAYFLLTNLNFSTSSSLLFTIEFPTVGFLGKIMPINTSPISQINIENQNPALDKITVDESSVKKGKILELLNNINKNRPDSVKIKTVSVVFSDSPLKNNFTWNDSGQTETFKGYEIDTSIDGGVVVYIYLNMESYSNFNWDKRSIQAEAEKLFYLALLSVDNQSDTASLIKKTNEIFETSTISDDDLLFEFN